MSLSLASVMVRSVFTISDRSLPLPWSKSGRSTSSGLPTYIYNVVVSGSSLVGVAVARSSYGISAWIGA